MQPLISDLSRLPLWLLILGLIVLVAIGWYWLGQLGQHVRVPKPSPRILTLLGGYVLSAFLAWCATTFIQAGFTERSGGQRGWNETHRLLFIAISLYLTPLVTRYLSNQ